MQRHFPAESGLLSARIRTAERTADILLCFLERGAELRVTDIVARVKLDKGTTSRLLSTLAARGLVVKDALTRRYRLGPAIFALGNAAQGQNNLAQLALPALTYMRDASGESASIDVLVGDARVCLAQVESRHDLRRVIEVGRPLPPYAGASGKVLLAHLPAATLEALLQRIALAPLTPNTITDRPALLKELRKVRGNGYAIGRSERIPGGAGVAVPVHGAQDEVVAALAISMPSSRYEPERLSDYLRWLTKAAKQIGAALGRGMKAA
jgi:IclR family transcriptional regulator, KDG regulon repressor